MARRLLAAGGRIGFVWRAVCSTARRLLAAAGRIGFVWRDGTRATRQPGRGLGSFGIPGSVWGGGFFPESGAGENGQIEVEGLQRAISSLTSVSLRDMFYMHHTMVRRSRQGKKPAVFVMCAEVLENPDPVFRCPSGWQRQGRRPWRWDHIVLEEAIGKLRLTLPPGAENGRHHLTSDRTVVLVPAFAFVSVRMDRE